MKYLFLITIASSLFFLPSCAKEQYSKEQEGLQASFNPENSLIKAVNNQSFLTDFLVNGTNRNSGQMSLDIHKIVSSTSSASKEELLQMESEMLETIRFIAIEAPDPSLDWLAQYVGLRYLRYAYLLDDSDENRAKTIELFYHLVNVEARDLDVLVDAFLKIEAHLPSSKRKEYINFLRSAYSTEVRLVDEGVRKFETLLASKTDSQSTFFIMEGKRLENRSLSYQYAHSQLPIIKQKGAIIMD